ncbi:DUF498-domain-containing protein [Cytidiella melzeri]|nr:DUF498-domain-containing protein [Cytidiella melzeri]
MLTRVVCPRSPHVAIAARQRLLHVTARLRTDSPTKFTNILAGTNVPATQVRTVTSEGVHLEDGRIIRGPCLFLEGKAFLWNVPQQQTEKVWEGWKEEHFEVFEVTIPKPELLLFGTGRRLVLPPPSIRQHLNKIGLQVDFMDTRNACSTYNLLAEEGRRVAAALLPPNAHHWKQD